MSILNFPKISISKTFNNQKSLSGRRIFFWNQWKYPINIVNQPLRRVFLYSSKKNNFSISSGNQCFTWLMNIINMYKTPSIVWDELPDNKMVLNDLLFYASNFKLSIIMCNPYICSNNNNFKTMI